MSITLELLLSFITTTTPGADTAPDLCDLVDSATGVPLLCAPRPDGAPVYDGNVCCSDDSCIPANRTCDADAVFYCELGEERADGGVDCYFLVPTYCDHYPCPSAPGYQPQIPSVAMAMCCHEGVCWPTSPEANNCELNDVFWCSDGVCNNDGTVTCFDDD